MAQLPLNKVKHDLAEVLVWTGQMLRRLSSSKMSLGSPWVVLMGRESLCCNHLCCPLHSGVDASGLNASIPTAEKNH